MKPKEKSVTLVTLVSRYGADDGGVDIYAILTLTAANAVMLQKLRPLMTTVRDAVASIKVANNPKYLELLLREVTVVPHYTTELLSNYGDEFFDQLDRNWYLVSPLAALRPAPVEDYVKAVWDSLILSDAGVRWTMINDKCDEPNQHETPLLSWHAIARIGANKDPEIGSVIGVSQIK